MSRWAAALVLGALLCSEPCHSEPGSAIPPASTFSTVPPPRFPTDSEALHALIRSGKLDEAQKLITAGVDVNGHDPLGNTPLLYAAWSGNAAAAALLLAHGADVNALQAGPTALECAVLAGRTEVVKLLLSAGARLNGRDRDGRCVLHVSARYGYTEITELLLSFHADVSATDAADHTPLDDAVLAAQSSVVPVLLHHGADPRRVRPGDGRGPVHEAAMKASAALLEMLVEAGADPAGRDKSGQTPLDLALAYQNRSAIAALEHLALERKDCEAAADRAMESATLRGHTELARLLLDGGFDVHKRSPAGSSYLHLAALKGQAKMVRLFLGRGAEVNAIDQTGGTALHNAALGGSAEVIALLLDQGARIDLADRESGATPLMLAASVAHAEAVALLLERGANPLLRDHAGHTALDRARQTEDSPTVKLLETARFRATPASKSAA